MADLLYKSPSSVGIFVLMSVFLLGGLTGTAFCQDTGYILMLQQTPANGGSVTPETGIHNFAVNQTVTLTATPKPGYQFICWLGDVSESITPGTTILIDGPKIVIAVFERAEFEYLAELGMRAAGLGQSGLTRSPVFVGGGGAVSPAGPDYEWPDYSFPDFPDIPPPGNDVPVPDGDEDFPVPDGEEIPEPATIVLFSIGFVSLRRFPRRYRPIL